MLDSYLYLYYTTLSSKQKKGIMQTPPISCTQDYIDIYGKEPVVHDPATKGQLFEDEGDIAMQEEADHYDLIESMHEQYLSSFGE